MGAVLGSTSPPGRGSVLRPAAQAAWVLNARTHPFVPPPAAAAAARPQPERYAFAPAAGPGNPQMGRYHSRAWQRESSPTQRPRVPSGGLSLINPGRSREGPAAAAKSPEA